MSDVSHEEVRDLFEQWNQALQTGDPKVVAALYESDAILLPTLSNQVRHNHPEIEDYFVHFLAKGPKGTINESNIRVEESIAIHAGIYTFAFQDGSEAQARFTYAYRKSAHGWKIIEHHSSLLPE
jgi:uncharacterized protein (TIGR02246 family)